MRGSVGAAALLAGLAVGAAACSDGSGVFPAEAWQTKAPAELRLDPQPLEELADALRKGAGAAGLVIKDGYIVKTWGDPTARVDWASAGKAVLTTMLLFALNEGRLSSLDDLIAEWGWTSPGDPSFGLQGKDRGVTFHHLANMTSGFDRDEAPGEAFAYNDNAVQLHARTLLRVFDAEAVPGTFNREALEPSRLGALRLQDGPLFGTTDPAHEGRAETAAVTSPRDLARIGWFWLNRGNWNGKQLLPERYFDRYAKPLVPADLPLSVAGVEKYLLIGSWGNRDTFDAPFGPGLYGLHWWFNGLVGTTGKRHWPDVPLDAFGVIGHYPEKAMFVIPSLRMVIVAYGDWSSGTYRGPRPRGRGQPHRYWDPGDPRGAFNVQLSRLVEAAR